MKDGNAPDLHLVCHSLLSDATAGTVSASRRRPRSRKLASWRSASRVAKSFTISVAQAICASSSQLHGELMRRAATSRALVNSDADPQHG